MAMLVSPADDAQVTRWALAAKAGDRAAAASFIAATHQQVYRFLTHLCDPGEAEDLTQETYLRALAALPRFAARAKALTWLLAIARRVAADRVRSATCRPRTTALDRWVDAADAARAGDGPRFEDEVLLRQLLAALSAPRREAFVATQLLGLSYAETAEICECPIGTVRSRVARAREELVAALSADGSADVVTR
jgi:RNA polymerase sigma-70 factor (ECF subfamily)